MKYFILTAALAFASTTAWAQEKQEATIKIVVDDNGKQKVIERHFSDISKAEGEIKKLSDSLDLVVKISGDVKKIIRVDVNKSHSIKSDKPGDVIIEKFEGGEEGSADKRVIIRRGGPGMAPQAPGAPAAPGFHGNESNVMIFRGEGGPEGMPKEFNIELDGPMGGPMKGLKKLMTEKGSKTIHGLSGEPNQPFNGKLNVEFMALEKGNVTIAVTDVNGKEIASELVKDFQGKYLGQIDLKKAGAGVYFLRVTQGNDGAVRRIKVD